MILAEECTLNLSHEHWSKLKHKDMQKLNVSEHVMTIFKKMLAIELINIKYQILKNAWSAILTPPMLSQHSRSQALVKEEGCDRRGEPTLNLAILMEMKPEKKIAFAGF